MLGFWCTHNESLARKNVSCDFVQLRDCSIVHRGYGGFFKCMLFFFPRHVEGPLKNLQPLISSSQFWGE